MSTVLDRGANGMAVLALAHPSGSTARIHLHGAHLTSWVPAGGVEALFLSRSAELAEGKAIRGGVPVVFPQFAQLGPLPKHGFARVLPWRWIDTEVSPDSSAQATLELTDSGVTRAIWPHPFRARMTVTLGERALSQRLAIENTGGSALSFTAALHSYFRVADLRDAAIRGLAGAGYEDRSARGEEVVERRDELVVSGEIDRVYVDAPSRLRLVDQGNRRAFELRFDGFRDAVVWNPSAYGASALPDMEADEYLHMICVEAAQVGHPVELAPGGGWQGGQRLEVVDV